jgi:uncharacterized protein involved in type VI secretion and phage assembly
MKLDLPFAIPPAWSFGVQLGVVVSIRDDKRMGRVQIKLLAPDADAEALVWARVAVPFAGGDRGAFLIPDVDDEVLVAFIAGDPRHPVVIGSLWNGAQTPPETIAGDRVDRWSFTGKNGTRIAIVEESAGRETISFETPSGVSGVLTDEAGGKIELAAAGNTITMEASGVAIDAPAGVTVKSAKVEITAGQVNVNAAMASFSGVVSCALLQTNSVVSASYTPGAGNVW